MNKKDFESKLFSLNKPYVDTVVHKNLLKLSLFEKLEKDKERRFSMFGWKQVSTFMLTIVLTFCAYYFLEGQKNQEKWTNPLTPSLVLAKAQEKFENGYKSGRYLHLLTENKIYFDGIEEYISKTQSQTNLDANSPKKHFRKEKVIDRGSSNFDLIMTDLTDEQIMTIYKQSEFSYQICTDCKIPPIRKYSKEEVSEHNNTPFSENLESISNIEEDGFPLIDIGSSTKEIGLAFGENTDQQSYFSDPDYEGSFNRLKKVDSVISLGAKEVDGVKYEKVTFPPELVDYENNITLVTELYFDKSDFTLKIAKYFFESHKGTALVKEVKYLLSEYLDEKPEIKIFGHNLESREDWSKILQNEVQNNMYKLEQAKYAEVVLKEDYGFVSPLVDESCNGYLLTRAWASFHTGVDFSKTNGCWISAIGDGIVEKARYCDEGGLGFCIVIKHANGFESLYAHGSGAFAVKEGDSVKAGEKIMYMGASGHVFGTSLHFSISKDNQDVMIYENRIDPKGIVPIKFE